MIREGARTGRAPNSGHFTRERVWHPSQALREERDGSLEMRMEASSRKEVVRWILSWVPEVQVLAPGELRRRIKAKLSEGLARNPGTPREAKAASR
jgi:predicted DNA-binding transcriptional regulator YafY